MRLLPALLLLAAVLPGADQPAPEVKAKAYTLTTCIVTDEKLDAMGGAVTLVHEGQEVKFCCKGCIKDFNKDPAKFLKKLAEAEAKAKAAPAKP